MEKESTVKKMIIRSVLIAFLTSLMSLILWKSYLIGINSTSEEESSAIGNSEQPSSQQQQILGTKATTKSTDSTASSTERSPVEQEILTLTNDLRTNPSGSLAREKPLPQECSTKDSLAPLTLDVEASETLAKNWSLQMLQATQKEIAAGVATDNAASNNLKHRDLEEQKIILTSLEKEFTTWGENIAWGRGYDAEIIAQTLFEGWRESDGHYCNMMNKDFTHIAIGHIADSENSLDWATQNFYG